jgi:LuxR family maltose regulon positive regulatory protein
MSRLPPHHIARPRLTDRCRDENVLVVVVEAAAGYGKSVLAAELVDTWGLVPVEVLLEEGPVSGRLLAGRLRAAAARAGFADAAGAMVSAGDDPAGAVDALTAALAGEPCAIVVDDAHHAARDAGVLIDRIASQVTAPQRLVVLARRLPPGTERLRRADPVFLRADDLALRAEETLVLCRAGFGLDVTADDVQALETLTGGWTAAAVLAASRAQRSAQPLWELAALGGGTPIDAVGSILDEVLVALGPDRARLGQVAPLALLDPGLVALVTGEPDFFDRAVAVGLPLTPAGEGWWELPGPVREHLATLEPPQPESLERAAAYYAERGRLDSALQVLLSAGKDEAAARLLASADARSIEELDAIVLLSLYERIPERVAERHPRAAFHVARGCGVAAFLSPRTRLLKRLEEQVAEEDDAPLRRAIDAERAVDLLNSGSPLDGEELGRQVLESATSGEALTRARALTAVGYGLCARRDKDGRLSEESLREAARAFDTAMDLYRSLGFREPASGIAAPRAIWTELGVGRPYAAMQVIDAALADCAGSPRRVGRLVFHRAQVLRELGRFDDAEADLAETGRIGAQHGDPILVAFAPWGHMVTASLRGDARRAMDMAALVEAARGDWWSAVGSEFLAEAADSLDRVGFAAQAWEYLERAKAEPRPSERWIALTECALLARHGDPCLAEEQLSAVHGHGIFPKEYWRVTLLGAYAAWRRGDRTAGARAAQAFAEAARLGQPQLPLIVERDLSESLLALALETGSPAAAALEASSLPLAVVMLGRFELTRGGRAIDLGSGQTSQLLKLVAVNGGRMQAERAIEALWPDADPVAGRPRLRTVLGRLRELAADAMSREGDVLVIGPDVRLDLVEFEREARQALAFGTGDRAAAIATAHSAIARYRGDLLPDDLYEEWADPPRQRARTAMLDLLDLCADGAVQRGDLDEARRLVQRTIELAPYDDDRYLRVATILSGQGRRGAALSVIRRARSTLATLGLELPPQLVELQDTLVGKRTADR